MALIKCQNCGKEISDRGKICPHCRTWIDANFIAAKKQEMLAEGERQFRETDEFKRAEKERERLSKLPACPICGSKENVKRIGSFSRSMSVLAWGIASSKVGKQYECLKCKHKW